MERTLVKTAIYSFITSFSALLVLIDRTGISEDFNEVGSSWATPYPDFFFMILKYSIIISIIIVISVYFIKMKLFIGFFPLLFVALGLLNYMFLTNDLVLTLFLLFYGVVFAIYNIIKKNYKTIAFISIIVVIGLLALFIVFWVLRN
ncbi:hypothetical protein [Peribacillus loiseleuriae]|uniref:hypothetical protein n=1 Tax=Peribacillus loiseleuriae TaxID=1679170 RepID=UPI003CFCF788